LWGKTGKKGQKKKTHYWGKKRRVGGLVGWGKKKKKNVNGPLTGRGRGGGAHGHKKNGNGGFGDTKSCCGGGGKKTEQALAGFTEGGGIKEFPGTSHVWGCRRRVKTRVGQKLGGPWNKSSEGGAGGQDTW